MNKNSFLKKLAKYDGAHFIRKVLKKNAVPLADIGSLIPETETKSTTTISPQAQEYIDNYHGGDILDFDSGEFLSSRQESDRENLSREDERNIWERKTEILSKQREDELLEDVKSPNWRESAERVFRFWGNLVYIIPVLGKKSPTERTKSRFVSWEDALPILEKSGLNIDQVDKNLKSGAIVFLAKTENDYSDIRLHPKNLIFSFFNDLYLEGDFSKDFGKIFSDFNQFLNKLYPRQEARDNTAAHAIAAAMVDPGSHDFWDKSHDLLGLLAEMLTEEVTKEKGFYFKNKREDEKLTMVENWIKNLGIKEMLINKLKGKIVLVRVSKTFA